MSQTNTDTDRENYPSYVGWEVHQPPSLCEADESGEDLAQALKLPDALTDRSKFHVAPPVFNSEAAGNL